MFFVVVVTVAVADVYVFLLVCRANLAKKLPFSFSIFEPVRTEEDALNQSSLS